MSGSTLQAVSRLCTSISSAGIRSRFFRLGIFAGDNLNAALVPLYRGPTLGGTTYGNATDINSGGLFVTGDYAENLGLLGSSSTPRKFLATGLENSVLGATGHMAYYGSSDMTSTTTHRAIECIVSGSGQFFLDQRNGSKLLFNYQTGATFEALLSNTQRGLRLAQRISATGMEAYIGATAQTDGSGSAGNNVTVVNTSDAFNIFSSVANFPYRMSAYSLGLTMTSGEVAAYNTAIVAFQTALGRN